MFFCFISTCGAGCFDNLISCGFSASTDLPVGSPSVVYHTNLQVDLAQLQLCSFNLLIVLILAVICRDIWYELPVVPNAKSFVFCLQMIH